MTENVDGRPNRRKKDAFSNLSGLVWTGLRVNVFKFFSCKTISVEIEYVRQTYPHIMLQSLQGGTGFWKHVCLDLENKRTKLT